MTFNLIAESNTNKSLCFQSSWVWVLFVGHKTQCQQIYIKLTGFEDNDGRKLSFKQYLLRCCSFEKLVKVTKAIFFLSEMKIILACRMY